MQIMYNHLNINNLLNFKFMFMKAKLKEIRESKGFSTYDVAKMMHITQSSYARIERGDTKIDLDRLSIFADVMEMSIVDVLMYPERYINIRDIGKEINNAGPEVIVQIRVKEKKREEILRMLFGDSDVEILKRD